MDRRRRSSSGKDLFEHLKEKPGGGGRAAASAAAAAAAQGSIEDGLKAADKTVKATYTIAYIAHAPLEPRAAVAEWDDGKLTVWTGTQRPFGVRGELARRFGLPEDKVRVIVPDTGSGYGGKHTGEAASRRPGWRRRRASRSSSSGRARRSSPGPTSARPA